MEVVEIGRRLRPVIGAAQFQRVVLGKDVRPANRNIDWAPALGANLLFEDVHQSCVSFKKF